MICRDTPTHGPFAIEIIMFNVCICVHVCVYACMCMHGHMCWGYPPTTHTPIHPTPHPQSQKEPKTPKFNLSLALIKIFQFCLKILYLQNTPRLISTIVGPPEYPPPTCPTPKSQGNPNQKHYNKY